VALFSLVVDGNGSFCFLHNHICNPFDEDIYEFLWWYHSGNIRKAIHGLVYRLVNSIIL
jgi:hypothetical protein